MYTGMGVLMCLNLPRRVQEICDGYRLGEFRRQHNLKCETSVETVNRQWMGSEKAVNRQ